MSDELNKKHAYKVLPKIKKVVEISFNACVYVGFILRW